MFGYTLAMDGQFIITAAFQEDANQNFLTSTVGSALADSNLSGNAAAIIAY